MKTNKCDIMNLGFEYKSSWGPSFQLYYNKKTNEYASVNVITEEAEIFNAGEE